MSKPIAELREKLARIANQSVEDMESACSGGNFDDAYWGGHTAGEVSVAKMVLEALGAETPS